MQYWIGITRKMNKAVLTALFTLIPILCAASNPPRITLILSSEQQVYQRVADSIKSSLETTVTIEEHTLDSIDGMQTPPEIILTVGSAAFKKALERFHSLPVIASFLPRRVYEKMVKSSSSALQNTTAIFIDQPMKRQLSLARLLTPSGTTIGTVFGASSISERQRLFNAAQETGFTVNSVVLNSNDNPVNTLQPIIQKADVFLAIPDQSAFNRASAKWSLFIALRLKKPLIGFSEKYVDAGALASLYSSPEQIGQHAAETLNTYLTTNLLPPPEHPKYFTVKVNQTSAKTIGIQIDNAEVIQQQLGGYH